MRMVAADRSPNLERCNTHTRAAIERETRAGQTIYDERGAVESKRP